MSKLINGVASEYDMPMPTTITTITKEQLEDLYLDMLHINKEKTDMIKKLEDRISLLEKNRKKAIEYLNNQIHYLEEQKRMLLYSGEITHQNGGIIAELKYRIREKQYLLDILKGDKDE